MARSFTTAVARFFSAADCWLCSLGVALLVLSVLLVPTSRALADDGGSGTLVEICDKTCNNGCTYNGVGCSHQVGNQGCNALPNCSVYCACKLCLNSQIPCGCKCSYSPSQCYMGGCP